VIKNAQEGTLRGGENGFYGVEQLPDAPLLAPHTGEVRARRGADGYPDTGKRFEKRRLSEPDVNGRSSISTSA
jgi:hypothetical protein